MHCDTDEKDRLNEKEDKGGDKEDDNDEKSEKKYVADGNGEHEVSILYVCKMYQLFGVT